VPIVEIDIVLRKGERLRRALAEDLADRLGEVFAAPSGTTWVKLRRLPVDDYAENGGRPSATGLPVFVSILKRRQPSRDRMQAEVDRITDLVAAACGRPPDHVHVIYRADGAGRVAFGGRIVE
jgi:phenylpyruvate tautomerase PptA (4-oxalocrotonate tautomerase family)